MGTYVVYKPGSFVMIGNKDKVPGLILAVMIEDVTYHTSYKVAWWNGKVRVVEWLTKDEFLVVPEQADTQQIGFHP